MPHEEALRVLIASGSLLTRAQLRLTLAHPIYALSEFDNGAKAFEALGKEPFDVLIADASLPVLDGLTLLRRSRPVLPAARTVLLHDTAVAIDEQRWKEAVREGVECVFSLDAILSPLAAFVLEAATVGNVRRKY